MDRKQQKGLAKRIICVGCSAVIAVAVLFCNNYVHKALAYMPSIYSEMSTKSETHHPLRPVKIDREDVGEVCHLGRRADAFSAIPDSRHLAAQPPGLCRKVFSRRNHKPKAILNPQRLSGCAGHDGNCRSGDIPAVDLLLSANAIPQLPVQEIQNWEFQISSSIVYRYSARHQRFPNDGHLFREFHF